MIKCLKLGEILIANKLTINAAKTHAMVFSPNINDSNKNFSLSCNGCLI